MRKIAGRVLFAVLLLLPLTAWGAMAIRYSAPFQGTNLTLAEIFGALGALAILGVFIRRLRGVTIAFLLLWVAVLIWWRRIPASNDRDWQPDVARLSYAEINGDLVTMHNIRNFDYRTETDYTPRYYDKTYDLNKLDSLDLIAVYWMGDAIAHIMVSFGFGGQDYLAVSIETRKERGESYSTLAGFFKQYELYYVVADERDVIRLRTNYRKDPPEDVYIYRVNVPRENVRKLFLDYIREINELKDHPAFYNTATTNCTTNVWMHSQVNQQSSFNWKILLSGYTPLYVYERGRLDQSLPFEELRRRSHVNDAAHQADQAPDFSQRIRTGLSTGSGMAKGKAG